MSSESNISNQVEETEVPVESNETNQRQKRDWKFVLKYSWMVKNIPFFLFLGVLAVAYIYNGHHADKLIRKIAKSEKAIKEKEYQYKSIKSEVIFRSKASELVKAVEPLGLKESKEPPLVIGLENKTDSTKKN